MVTVFGKFADPLADKILTTAAFIYMLLEGVCAPAVLILVLFREFAVSGLRMVAAGSRNGEVIAANMWGKYKTATQMIMIILLILDSDIQALQVITQILVWVSLALTIISLVTYIVQNKKVLTMQK